MRYLKHWIWTTTIFSITGHLRYWIQNLQKSSKWRLYHLRSTWARDKEFLIRNGHLFNSHQRCGSISMTTYRGQGRNPITSLFSWDSSGWIATQLSSTKTSEPENGSNDTMVGVSTKIRTNKLKENAVDQLNYETFSILLSLTSRIFSNLTLFNFFHLHFINSFRKINIWNLFTV